MKGKALITLSLPVAGLLAYFCWPAADKPVAGAAGAGAAAAKAVVPAAVETDLALAIEQKTVIAEFIGNARDHMKIVLMNKGAEPLKVTVPVGQIFESESSGSVVAVRPATVDLTPSKTREVNVRVAALHSSNTVGDVLFQLSYTTIPKIEPLLLKV